MENFIQIPGIKNKCNVLKIIAFLKYFTVNTLPLYEYALKAKHYFSTLMNISWKKEPSVNKTTSDCHMKLIA